MARDPVKIYWRGLDVEGTPVHSTNNENASFPVHNIGDRNWHTHWKCPVTKESWFILDVESQVTGSLPGFDGDVTHLVIAGHNFVYLTNMNYVNINTFTSDDPAGGTPEWWLVGDGYYGGVNKWGITKDAEGDLPGLWILPFKALATASARRYWKIILNGPAATGDATLFGVAMITGELAFTATPALPRNLSSRFGLDLTDVRGRVWANEYHGRKNAWKLHWPDIPDSEKVEYFEFWEHIHGGLYPFLMQDTDGEIHWVRVIPSMARSGVGYSESKYLNWDIPLHVEEEL